ncbi:hypothetical protein, partial [Allorhizocola rhizosphaerae]|uniref:hypothetical protein n=1 Tax=Allorhizocola rhizosphaerae TaxID=1872709 RepID=UPI001B8AB84E
MHACDRCGSPLGPRKGLLDEVLASVGTIAAAQRDAEAVVYPPRSLRGLIMKLMPRRAVEHGLKFMINGRGWVGVVG